jgi:tetratricopeptide (TPR) repeat protein
MRVWLGRIHHQLGQVDEEVEAFAHAIDIDPDGLLVYQVLAQVQDQTNDLVGAIEVYDKLVESRPESAQLQYQLGFNLARIEENGNAIAALEKSLSINSEMVQASYLLGVVYQGEGRFEDSIRHLESYLEHDAGNLGAKVNLAGSYARKSDYAKAIELYDEVIQLDEDREGSNDVQHRLSQNYLRLRKGNIENGSGLSAPNAAPFIGTILQALARKQAGEPIAPLVNALETTEGDLNTECDFYLNGLIGLFDGEDAGPFLERELKSLLREAGRSYALEIVLGRLLMAIDKHEEAEEVLLGILTNYGGDKWLHYYFATLYEELERPQDTEGHLRACLEFDPENPDVMNFLGYHLAEQDIRLPEAEQLLLRALEKDLDNGFYMDSLGWIYYRMGRSGRAVELISRAIRLMRTDDGVLRDHLGDAYLLNGQRKQAVAEWKRAVRLDPTLEGIQEKIEAHSEPEAAVQ